MRLCACVNVFSSIDCARGLSDWAELWSVTEALAQACTEASACVWLCVSVTWLTSATVFHFPCHTETLWCVWGHRWFVCILTNSTVSASVFTVDQSLPSTTLAPSTITYFALSLLAPSQTFIWCLNEVFLWPLTDPGPAVEYYEDNMLRNLNLNAMLLIFSIATAWTLLHHLLCLTLCFVLQVYFSFIWSRQAADTFKGKVSSNFIKVKTI